MPQAIPFAIVTAFGLEGAAAAFVYIVSSVAIGVYQSDRAESKARKAARDAAMERTVTVRSGVAPRRLVLGTARTGGVLAHGDFIGPRKRYLDMVLAFSANQLSSIEGFFFGDEFVAMADVVDGVPVKGQYSITGADADDTSSVGIIYRTIGFGTSSGTAQSFTVDYDIASSDTNLIKVEGTRIGSEGGDYAIYTVASIVGRTITTTQPVHAGLEVSVTFPINGYEHPLANGDEPPMRLQWRLGTPDQDAMLWTELGVSSDKWTADHRLRGVSCLRALMDIEANAYKAGEPNINILARGPVGVYDPRTGTTINGTSNPALLAAWYRTLPRSDGGMGIPSSWIDWPSVAVAANICDEQIQVRNSAGELVWVKRYECNTVLVLDQPRNANLREILNCMAGEFPFTAGMYRCYAGAFRPAAITLTDADIAAEDAIQFGPAGSTFDSPPNVVSATFTDSANNYLDNSPAPVVNVEYVTLDGGEEILDLQLTGVTDANRAHYLMGVRLEQARPALAGVLSVRGRGANLALMETVQLQMQGYESLAGKTFEIRRRENAWNGRYRLEMVEVRPNTWLLNPDTFTPLVPVPKPDTSGRWRVAKLTNVAAASGTSTLQVLADGTILARALLTWDAHPNAYVHNGGTIEVRYRPFTGTPWLDMSAATDWVYLPPLLGNSTEAYIGPLIDGQYYAAEVRAVNSPFGAVSAWERVPFQALGKSEPPRDVPFINYEITTDGVLLSVPENQDLDRDVTELRVGGLDWATAVPLVGTQPTRFAGTTYLWPRPAPGIYRVRARYVDTSGNLSANTTYVDAVVTAADAVEWAEVGGRPRTWRVGAVGYLVTGITIGPGFFNGESGAQIGAWARSWMLMAIRRSDDQVVFGPQYYDVMSEGTDPENPLAYGRGSLALAADLNALGNNVWAVVTTYDEPATNRLSGGLPAALKRIGARQATLDAIGYRGAYVCVGVPGVGEGGAIFEGVRNGATAWIDMSFQTFKGQVLGVSAADGGVNSALALAASAKSTADGKIDTFYQDDPPPSAGEGDLWFDTNDGRKLYVRSAFGSWVPADDVRIGNAVTAAAGAQATADGKVTTFYASSPPGAGAVGDLWFNTSNGRSYRWNGGAWLLVTTVGAGDITTALLADEAATSIYPMSFVDSHIWDAPNTTGWPRAVIGTLTFVAPATGPALVTADVVARTTMPTSGAVPTYAYHVINTAWLVNGSYTGGEKRRHGPEVDMLPGGEYWLSVVRTLDINVTAGVSYTVQLTAEATTTTIDSLPIDNRASGRLRLEMIKK